MREITLPRQALEEAMAEEMRRDARVYHDGHRRHRRPLLTEFGADARALHADLRGGDDRHRGSARPAAASARSSTGGSVTFALRGDGPGRQPGVQDPLHVRRPARLPDRLTAAIYRRRHRARPPSTRRPATRCTRTWPGSRSCCRRAPADAKGLLKSAIRDNNPVVCFEASRLDPVEEARCRTATTWCRSASPTVKRAGTRRDDRRRSATWSTRRWRRPRSWRPRASRSR